jgi:hypothetical protein
LTMIQLACERQLSACRKSPLPAAPLALLSRRTQRRHSHSGSSSAHTHKANALTNMRAAHEQVGRHQGYVGEPVRILAKSECLRAREVAGLMARSDPQPPTTHTQTNKQTNKHTHEHIPTRTRTHTHMHTHAHAHAHAYAHAHAPAWRRARPAQICSG